MSILNRPLDNTKTKAVLGSMDFESLYTSGIGYEIFLKGLRDEAKIIGTVCSKTKKVFLPARLFNERNMERMTETKTVSGPGTLSSFTTVHIDLEGKQLNEPKTVGYVTWDGFEGGVIHFINANKKPLKIGIKVKPIFKPESERTGSILDLSHFEVA